MDIVYTAVVAATGSGREGHVASDDGLLDLDLASPEGLGGRGGEVNPEMLFAAGYAACFHSALLHAARGRKLRLHGSSVTARVGIGANAAGGFGLEVKLDVDIPGVPNAVGRELVDLAHDVCPYSNAVRGNVDVDISIVEDRLGG